MHYASAHTPSSFHEYQVNALNSQVDPVYIEFRREFMTLPVPFSFLSLLMSCGWYSSVCQLSFVVVVVCLEEVATFLHWGQNSSEYQIYVFYSHYTSLSSIFQKKTRRKGGGEGEKHFKSIVCNKFWCFHCFLSHKRLSSIHSIVFCPFCLPFPLPNNVFAYYYYCSIKLISC